MCAQRIECAENRKKPLATLQLNARNWLKKNTRGGEMTTLANAFTGDRIQIQATPKTGMIANQSQQRKQIILSFCEVSAS